MPTDLSITTCGLFLSEQVISSTRLSVATTVALICVVAFRTAPPIGGLSCIYFLVRREKKRSNSLKVSIVNAVHARFKQQEAHQMMWLSETPRRAI